MSYQVEVLPATAHPLYDTRESGKTHTPFALERALCTAIELGDEAAMDRAIADYMVHGFVVGTMSGDRLRQVKYWAVATVAIAIHYAILGGLDETDAYHLSDAYLREVDRLDTMDACIDCLRRRATELVRAVASAKSGTLLSSPVRRCVHYIHIHLHEKMPLPLLASEAGLSKDYLGVRFKREMGVSVHAYILQQRLQASLPMLLDGTGCRRIAYDLGFADESHYIAAFRKQYGCTPAQYRRVHTD